MDSPDSKPRTNTCMPAKKRVIVIGSGLGGLSAAISLAQEGYEVTIHEKNAQIGGKLNQLKAQGYTFVTVSELLAAGTPEIVSTCYNVKFGDTDRYDNLATAFRRNFFARGAGEKGTSAGPTRTSKPSKSWQPTVKPRP